MSSPLLVRALNLSIFALPVVMAGGAVILVGAPRLPAPVPPAALFAPVALACAAPAVAPQPVRRARMTDEGCRETPARR